MAKKILILCCGYPYSTDMGFGYHVWQVLNKMNLPGNVECREVGFSACMMPHIISEKDKVLIIDVFHTNDAPGTVVRLDQRQVPLTVRGKTDTAKMHLIETLEQIQLLGPCPTVIFLGVVPVDDQTPGEQLTPELQSKISVVIEMIQHEISA